jgi:acyl-ACP thioesterase
MTTPLKKLWTEHYRITSLLVNPLGRLGLYGILNLLQETAWMHAETLGFGMKGMEEKGLIWVLTRQSLKMQDWPSFNSKITIETWLRPPMGAFAIREFSIKNEEGHEIGTCTTSWLALDKDSKTILPSQNLYPWSEITLERSTDLVADKVSVEGEYEHLAKYRVRNSDLDINQHVNNTKYSQWILDAIPYDLHSKLRLQSYTVNFLAETHLGDQVEIDRSCSSSSAPEDVRGVTNYRGVRISDAKILFTARLEWEQRSATSPPR